MHFQRPGAKAAPRPARASGGPLSEVGRRVLIVLGAWSIRYGLFVEVELQ